MADFGGIESHLRVAGMSIALYDALWTLPAEITLYREQKSFKKMTRACILFILIRYTSIVVLTVGNVGFFSQSFTASSCRIFFLAAPILKVFQTMISQVILALRTIAVARQRRWVVWTVATVCVVTVMLEFLANIVTRQPFRSPAGAKLTNCTSGNHKGARIVWVHYLSAIMYDGTCLSITTGLIYSQWRKLSRQKAFYHSLDSLSQMLLKEGVLYFTLLTATNLFNLCLYMTISTQAQSAGATLGYAFTWIMSQRLVIHLQEFGHAIRAHDQPPSTTNASKSTSSYFVPPHTTNNDTPDGPGDDLELSVHVTIEEDVKVDYDQDIADGGLVTSKHRIASARIEQEYRQREERRKQQGGEETDEESQKGWQVTTIGKIFSP